MSLREIFGRPEWLFALFALPLIALLIWHERRDRRRRLSAVLGARAERLADAFPVPGRTGRAWIFLAALGFALLAVAQPLWTGRNARLDRRSVDCVVCLDVSQSMLARDLAPSRLRQAQEQIEFLAHRTQGDRFGLVVFAGEARLLCPLTQDVEAFASLASSASPQSVGRGGSDVGAALELASRLFEGGAESEKTILLLSDGEDLAGRGAEAAAACKVQKISIHAVGFGSQRGSKISLREGAERFLRDRAGKDVISAMDAAGLKAIAATAGGSFADAAESPNALSGIYERQILPLARLPSRGSGPSGPANRFQWPLFLAFLLWSFEMSSRERSRP